MVAAEEPEDVTIMLQQELAVAQKRAIQFETALVVVTVVYIIIYIICKKNKDDCYKSSFNILSHYRSNIY